ncbi:MAG: tRNA lysidine(34) synthetase TilS [Christensenellaceae bacterium]|nr:tRNA lysidine(34) synthetase TilS [Christensenellaceae bacterium]
MQSLKEYCTLTPGQKLGAAVSGGADSMVLLHVLLSHCKKLGLQLVALHYEHGIRGAQSLADAAFVEETCKRLCVPLVMEHGDAPAAAKESGAGLEAAARQLRYDFFARAADSHGLCAVAVAHHRGDDAETFLLHLLRGSGMGGLLPMAAKRGCILRPMLDLSKADIIAYANERGIPFREDATNADPAYTRNYIRHRIIPALEAVNPRAEEAITRTASLLAEEDEALQQMSKKAAEACLFKDGDDHVIDLASFAKEPTAIRRRLLRRVLADICTLTDLDKNTVDRLLELADSRKTGRSFAEEGKFFARVSYNTLIIGRKMYKIERSGCFSIHPGCTPLWEGETFLWEDSEMPICWPQATAPWQVVPRDALLGACIRSRRDGDRIMPFGMSGSKKLSDYLIDHKVPREKRDRLVLLARGSEVLWVVGHTISEKLRLCPGMPAAKIAYKKSGEN